MSESHLDWGVRRSGHRHWVQEWLYGRASPLYDAFIRWAFWPLGGERACRLEFAGWLATRANQRVVSLCCGTGATDRAIAELEPTARITGVDLGRSQLGRARRKDHSGRIEYRVGNAARTGLADASYDRVLIVGALQEMPRALRIDVLREARRLCGADGRVLAVELAPLRGLASWWRALWLLHWIPGNPEPTTTREMLASSLFRELEFAGLGVIEDSTTRPAWFQGIVAVPRSRDLD